MDALQTSRQSAPWKDPEAQYVFGLLEWSIGALSWKEKEAKWHQLVPPILKMIDDMDATWKARGCHTLGILLESLRQPCSKGESFETANRQASMDFLQRTGYHDVFAQALLPLFTYIPCLTPEAEAVPLFKELLPTLTSLALLVPVENGKGGTRVKFLDKVVREGILSPLSHFSTPWTYPELATVIVSRLRVLLGHLGIESVKHLRDIIPLLSAILQEPFIVSHKGLTLSTLSGLQAAMQNGWPRIPGHRGDMMLGLCLCWSRCMDDSSSLEYIGEVKAEIQATVAMLDAIMQAAEERDTWVDEMADVVSTCAAYQDLFVGCGQRA